MKKVLCMLLTLALLLSMLMISSNAAEVDEADIGAEVDVLTTGGLTIQQLRNKFPSGSYFNHSLNGTNNPDVVTYTPCPSNHDVVDTCTWFGGSSQCMGFAKKVTYDYYGSMFSAWSTSNNLNSLKAGDVIKYYPAGPQHFIWVTSVSGNTIKYVDCNGDFHCGIQWDRSTTKSTIQSKGFSCIYVAPREISDVPKPSDAWVNYRYSAIPTGTANFFTFGATNATSYNIRIDKDGTRWKFEQGVSSDKGYMFWDAGNYTVWIAAINSSGSIESYKMNFTVFVPITLGNSFVANITNSISAKNLSADEDNNVFNETKSESDTQKWRFELQSDNTYKITNLAYSKCMDVAGSIKTEPNTNIGIWGDAGSSAQRFYIRQNNNGYAIVPKANTGLALDIAYSNYANGANVIDYNYNGQPNQTFSIDGYYGLEPSQVKEYNGHTYEYYEMAVPWEQAVRICEKKGGHLVTISNQAENDIVSGMISDSIWLGARTLGKDSSWFWTNCEIMTYTNWSSSQPDYYKDIEFFVMMYSATGKWNDYPNTTAVNFVCEYDNGDIDAEKYTSKKTLEENGVTYDFFDYKVDWQTAEAICEAKGGHLVKIDNAEENQLVGEIMSQGSMDEYWIDATDRNSEGIWTDHEGNLLTYTNWADGEPNNDFNIEQYGFRMKSSDQWADLKGYAPNYRNTGFICEYEPKKVTLGDADGNGIVEIVDATIIQRHLSNLTVPYSEETLMNADVDGDGELTVLDATFIQRYIAKIETHYPIGEPIT